MPQASDEQQALMERWFGDPIDDHGPIRFLYSRGYTFHYGQTGHWRKPARFHTISFEEQACADFLVDEWDHTYDFHEDS